MEVNLQGEIVLRHLERFLGPLKKRWLNDAAPSFQVLLFSDRPKRDSQCLVTYGLSAHLLQIVGNGDSTIKMELLICADSSFDPEALAALLFAVGQDAVTQHATPGVRKVLMGSGAILLNPVFEHFYLTFPGYFPAEFEMCEAVSSPVAIVQLIPISSKEREAIEKQGWRAFEDGMVEQHIDLLAFDNRRELMAT